VLSIAKKAKATILSNDSFQEFHGEHEWLFDDDRLVGGKPVPHVGWVWVSRNPVRGPVSRKAVRASNPSSSRKAVADEASTNVDREPTARRGSARRVSKEAAAPMPVPTSPPPGRATPPADARAVATASTSHPGDVVNELMPFLDFVQHHPVGTSVNAIVDSYSSHGAYVKIGNVFGYVPLRLMSDPPPRSARDVMHIGDAVTLVVASFAPARRSIDCAVPNMASVVEPQDGEAVVAEAARADAPAKRSAGKRSAGKKAAAKQTRDPAGEPAREKAAAASPTKAAAKKLAPPRAAKRTPTARSSATTTPKAPAEDLVKEPAKQPTGNRRTPAAAPARKAAPRAANKRSSTDASALEAVSPAARARRRGPRSANGPLDPSSEAPPEAGALAPPEESRASGAPERPQPSRRTQAAKRAADA
jgi:hypothetical protein